MAKPEAEKRKRRASESPLQSPIRISLEHKEAPAKQQNVNVKGLFLNGVENIRCFEELGFMIFNILKGIMSGIILVMLFKCAKAKESSHSHINYIKELTFPLTSL